MKNATRSTLSILALVGLVLGSAPTASAAAVSTSDALALEAGSQARATVDEYLAREDVAAELAALGVDPELARLRAAALTDSELAQLAGRIADQPAGGDGVVVAIGITFVVLLILELVGVIDIFKRF